MCNYYQSKTYSKEGYADVRPCQYHEECRCDEIRKGMASHVETLRDVVHAF